MNKLMAMAIAIGLIVALTSIIQITLELRPRGQQITTVIQPIYVTIPMQREVIISPITITITQGMVTEFLPYTIAYTLTTTVYPGTPIDTVPPITHTVTLNHTQIYTITETLRETITLINYAEVHEISINVSLPPGSKAILHPDNTSLTLIESQYMEIANMLDLGIKSFSCTNCDLRIARFGDINALEMTPREHWTVIEFELSKPINIDNGMLWIYVPGLRWDLNLNEVYLRVGDANIGVSRDNIRLRFLPLGQLYSIPLSGIPSIDKLTMKLHLYTAHEKITIVPLITSSYRPTQIYIVLSVPILNFMLRNNLCRPHWFSGIAKDLYICYLDIHAKAVSVSRVMEYVEEVYMAIAVYIDVEAYRMRNTIVIVSIDPYPQLNIDQIPINKEAIHTIYITIKPKIW